MDNGTNTEYRITILTNMKKILLVSSVLALVSLSLVPSFVFASSATAGKIKMDVWDPTILKGPLVICSGGPLNPDGTSNNSACQDLCDLVAEILNVIYFAIAFVLWIAVPVSVAAGGIMYMLAGSNPEMTKRAKAILTGVAWGIAIVLCAYILISTFVAVIGINNVGGFGQSACSINQ